MRALLRNVPILRALIIFSIARELFVLALIAGGKLDSFGDLSSFAAIANEWIGTTALFAFGALELAARLHGGPSRAAKAVALAWAIQLAVPLALSVAMAVHKFDDGVPAWVYPKLRWIDLGCELAAAAALAIAAWPRRAQAIAGAAVMIATAPPIIGLVLEHVLAPAADESGLRTQALVRGACDILHVVALGYLVVQARPAQPVPDDRYAARGLRLMSNALWTQLAVVLGAALVLFMLASSHDDASWLARAVVVGKFALAFAIMGAFGLGALAVVRAAPHDGKVGAFALAAVAALWVAGINADKALEAYRMMYVYSSGPFGMSSYDLQSLEQLSIIGPLVAVLAIGAGLVGLGRLPTLGPLHPTASTRTAMFATLMIASVGLQGYVLPRADDHGSQLGVMLIAGLVGLVAMGVAAHVLGRAAQIFELDRPNLPTAQVRS